MASHIFSLKENCSNLILEKFMYYKLDLEYLEPNLYTRHLVCTFDWTITKMKTIFSTKLRKGYSDRDTCRAPAVHSDLPLHLLCAHM